MYTVHYVYIHRLKKASVEDTDTPKENGDPMNNVMDSIRSGVKLRKANVDQKPPPSREHTVVVD